MKLGIHISNLESGMMIDWKILDTIHIHSVAQTLQNFSFSLFSSCEVLTELDSAFGIVLSAVTKKNSCFKFVAWIKKLRPTRRFETVFL